VSVTAATVKIVAEDAAVIDARIERITRHPFRAKFHLRPQELNYLASRALDTVRRHARELIIARVAPAHPAKDGTQTPWGGHPVFRAHTPPEPAAAAASRGTTTFVPVTTGSIPGSPTSGGRRPAGTEVQSPHA
jgi:hypothetical protein